MKKLIKIIPILCLLPALFTQIAFAAPVYIDSLADFPAYPYNTGAYMVGGRYVGCGPTTGAMIFGYFQHYFGLVDLLDNPVAGINEGLDTAWELHHNYMMTQADGFGSVLNIKPGLEGYAAFMGHEVSVVAHAPVGTDPITSWYNDYGAYGDAWMDDGFFWVDLGGGDWDIDPDDFCDFVGPKLTSGITIMVTVDSDGDGGGDHWVPCVGTDKDTDEFYFYNTYDTTEQSATIEYCGKPGGAGVNAISFVRSIEYIPQPEDGIPPVASFTESEHGGPVGTTIDFDASGSTDPDGSIILYEWDFDGDGVYDATGVTQSHTYMVPGIFTVTLRVMDNDCNTDTATDTKTIGPMQVIPEIPFGTIMASAAMIIALVAYVTMPKWRRKQTDISS